MFEVLHLCENVGLSLLEDGKLVSGERQLLPDPLLLTAARHTHPSITPSGIVLKKGAVHNGLIFLTARRSWLFQ